MLRPVLALAVISWTAWAAVAAPASELETIVFTATITGTQQTVVTAVRRGVDELGCTVRHNDVDRQTLAFTTREPGRLVAVRGRASSARLAVTVNATGTRRSTRTVSGAATECDVPPETSETRCRPSPFPARVNAVLPSFGAVRVTGAAVRRRDTLRCGPRPVPARAFLVRAAGRFTAALLSDRTAVRIHLRGNARFTDTFRSGARRVTTVRWTLTLRRAD